VESTDEDLPALEVEGPWIVELLGGEPRTALGALVDTEEELGTEPRTPLDVLEDVEATFCELDLMADCEDTRDAEIVLLVNLLDTLGTLPFVGTRDVLKGLSWPMPSSVVGLPEFCKSWDTAVAASFAALLICWVEL
jgi:hypothetical protein